jgi:hypothetical protein
VLRRFCCGCGGNCCADRKLHGQYDANRSLEVSATYCEVVMEL